MSEPLTREVIFHTIINEMTMRIMVRSFYPNSTMTEEQARRTATKDAIANTWYWYNHQEQFLTKLFYPIWGKKK